MGILENPQLQDLLSHHERNLCAKFQLSRTKFWLSDSKSIS